MCSSNIVVVYLPSITHIVCTQRINGKGRLACLWKSQETKQVPSRIVEGRALVREQGNMCCRCASQQPEYSAYREPSFGHAIFTVLNETTATFEWWDPTDARAALLVERCELHLTI